MRLLLSLLIGMSLLAQPVGKTLAVASFLSNQDYIAANLCENRARPEMHCNGKCHLRKQLDRQERQAGPVLPGIANEFCAVSCFDEPFEGFAVSTAAYIFSSLLYRDYSAPGTAFFHPPDVLA